METAFRELLESVRPEVDRRLKRRWDRSLRDAKRYGSGVTSMIRAARSLTLRGGKRFRAALAAAAYLGVAPRARLDVAIDAGVALELLQTYLLIQDDWIDDDAQRRGGPSVHHALARALRDERLGAASAILASDLTWGLAVETLVSAKVAPDRAVAAMKVFTRIHEDVVIGQQLDVLGRAEDVEIVHALKTGSYTVRGPLAVGATLAGASKRVLARLDRYAAPVGVAFQLRDDLLGAFGSPADTGKPRFGDLRAGRNTALVAAARRRLDPAGRRALDRVLGNGEADVRALRDATSALVTCGAAEAVMARLEALCAQAEALAADLPLSARARAALRGAAGALRWKLPPPGHRQARATRAA